MKFSVVVPTYNRKDVLRQCLAALMKQDATDYEIIVVDDGSTDGTGRVVATEFPSLCYIHQENRGPASARNRGIAAATGEIVAFTDDDCLPPRDWLTSLADGYRRYPDVAGVGGYLEAPELVLRTNLIARYEFYVSHTVYRASDQEYLGGFECPAGGTNSMSFRKSILQAVGGFDETFPYAAGEDADLKWRICQLGQPLLYVPSRVLHLQPYTWEAFRQQQMIRGRGAVHFERKHAHIPSCSRVLLRLGKRSLLFLPDGFRLGLALAWVKLWAGWFECWGQWLEINKMRRIA